LTASQGSAVALYKSLPYDPLHDFVPVALFGLQPSVLVAAPSKGWTSVTDLVGAAKAKPGALNFASAGLGSASHWAGERLRLAAGIDVQHIPFRGPVEAFTEVMTGRVDFYYLPIAPALPNIRDGKVVALAVSTSKRAPMLPTVTTVVEAGYPDAQYLFWGGRPAGKDPARHRRSAARGNAEGARGAGGAGEIGHIRRRADTDDGGRVRQILPRRRRGDCDARKRRQPRADQLTRRAFATSRSRPVRHGKTAMWNA
jgi:Tripartite tricarboxylate transporter family receptor